MPEQELNRRHRDNKIPMLNTNHINRKWLNLPYGTHLPAQQLDIYLPESGDGPFPVIMAIHGGAFKGGDKADVQLKPMLEGLSRQYAVVSINYRLSGEAIFPAQIHDIKAAIRWVKASGTNYRLDGEKIALWGGSAGGHLAALAGTSAHITELEDAAAGSFEHSCHVQAVVDWFGPTDFLTMDELFAESDVEPALVHLAADSPESLLIGNKITEEPEKVRAANPETYISRHTPPFFIQHGTRDAIIPAMQSVILYEKLKKAIGEDDVQLELLEGAGHSGPEFETEDNICKVLDFIDMHLKRIRQ
ncbi:alpha/beta hydrolase [Paenibacillus tarimensis]|uniref:alpha/beta hydrolase n=1 Tax=Paenibacillus tarimensis TaxID=416012 RepID=UPI001F25CB83|nr:alpha/beta hydrolase [Paenibacillus tarimensis]MCF2945483.1 alpha/beta hydrolase [Paenibacillus tarimensis]